MFEIDCYNYLLKNLSARRSSDFFVSLQILFYVQFFLIPYMYNKNPIYV